MATFTVTSWPVDRITARAAWCVPLGRRSRCWGTMADARERERADTPAPASAGRRSGGFAAAVPTWGRFNSSREEGRVVGATFSLGPPSSGRARLSFVICAAFSPRRKWSRGGGGGARVCGPRSRALTSTCGTLVGERTLPAAPSSCRARVGISARNAAPRRKSAEQREPRKGYRQEKKRESAGLSCNH